MNQDNNADNDEDEFGYQNPLFRAQQTNNLTVQKDS
jgi:hypothetical protein